MSDGHDTSCTYNKCGHPEAATTCPFVKDDNPSSKYIGVDWDYKLIQSMTPDELDKWEPPRKKVRIAVSYKVRYQMLVEHPYCTLCGLTAEDGVRLEIDHIDGNPSNNRRDNYQVLCQPCNLGKGG